MPDPTANNSTTYCTGVDANGLSVPTTNTRVQVAADASIFSGGNAAAIIMPGSGTLYISSTVDGGANSGFSLTNGAPYYSYSDPYAGVSPSGSDGYGQIFPSNSAQVAAAASGTLTGTEAIRMEKRSDNPYGFVTIYIENQGTISGTNGMAIVGPVGTQIQVSSGQTGKIGTISTRVITAINAGLINGGALSAITSAAPPPKLAIPARSGHQAMPQHCPSQAARSSMRVQASSATWGAAWSLTQAARCRSSTGQGQASA